MKGLCLLGLLCALHSVAAIDSEAASFGMDSNIDNVEANLGRIWIEVSAVTEYIDEVDLNDPEEYDSPKTLIVKPKDEAANNVMRRKIGIKIPDYSQYPEIRVLDLQTNCNIYNFGEVFKIYQMGLEELVVSDHTSLEYFYREDYSVSIKDLVEFMNRNQDKKDKFDKILNKYNIDYTKETIYIRGTEIIDLLEIAGIDIMRSCIL